MATRGRSQIGQTSRFRDENPDNAASPSHPPSATRDGVTVITQSTRSSSFDKTQILLKKVVGKNAIVTMDVLTRAQSRALL